MTLTGKLANVSLETITAESVYATKGNIVYPGTQTQAAAAEAAAAQRLTDAAGASQPVTVTAGSIQVGS